MTLRLLVFTCLLCQARAAESGITGSVLGFLFDPANGIQPILGVPGAATIGPPLDLGMQLLSVAVSPQQDYALATTDSDGTLTIGLGSSVSLRRQTISVAPDALAALSPTGSAAAVYDQGRNRIQVITGLPDAPAITCEFDLSALPGALLALAISDGGDAVLAGFSDGVVALVSDGRVRTISAPERATAARFLRKSGDAVIAGRSGVYLVRDVTGAAETTLLAAEADGISEPIAVAASNDGKRVFAASARSRAVAVIELAAGAITVTSCSCEPSALAALNGNAVFRLTEPSGGPVWLFDGDSSEPRIVFVPPYRPQPEGGAQ
jgi:hypothetical protein